MWETEVITFFHHALIATLIQKVIHLKNTQRAISYRVREYDDSKYVVEAYSLNLQDELEYQLYFSTFMREDNTLTAPSRLLMRCSTERFKEEVWSKSSFWAYIQNQCEAHNYKAPPITNNLDRFNFFLATHYFCKKGTVQSDYLHSLNELTYRYIQKHNAEVYLWMAGPGSKYNDGVPFIQELDDRDIPRMMHDFLLSVGYISHSEYEESRSDNHYLFQFFRDIGYISNEEEVTPVTLATIIRKFLSNAKDLTQIVQNNNSRNLARAKELLADEISKIQCLNVGQANCSLGFGNANKNNPLAIFDLGAFPQQAKFIQGKLGKATAEGIVVISHYDRDHINGVKYLDNAAANRVWILPQKRLNVSVTEGKLHDFINPQTKLYLSNIDYAKEPFDPSKHTQKIGNLTIYRGNCKKKDKQQSTSENARSLMCFVEKSKSILLPGDCLYGEFPIRFSVDYLAVPHHSCFYDTAIKNIDLSRVKELIIFAGPDEGYGHPDISHIGNLMSGSCNVVYLMKHNGFYFDNKVKVLGAQISITKKCHIIDL